MGYLKETLANSDDSLVFIKMMIRACGPSSVTRILGDLGWRVGEDNEVIRGGQLDHSLLDGETDDEKAERVKRVIKHLENDVGIEVDRD